MSIRSFILTAAIGFAGFGTATASASPATANNGGGGGGGGFVCTNGQIGVGCIGSIAVLPINVNIKDISVLDDADLKVLSDDLNGLSILDGGILNNNTILNDVYATVLNDFLTKFSIPVEGNDIGVCTSVLGIQLCKQ
jgi:hypothetical protein